MVEKFEAIELKGKEEATKAPEGKLSVPGAIFSLTKTAIGVGILYSPGVMHSCGLVLGVFMLLFAGVTSCISLHFIGRATAHTKTTDYVRKLYLYKAWLE